MPFVTIFLHLKHRITKTATKEDDMKFFIFLLIIAGGLYYAYSAGMFDSVINSAQNTAQRTVKLFARCCFYAIFPLSVKLNRFAGANVIL